MRAKPNERASALALQPPVIRRFPRARGPLARKQSREIKFQMQGNAKATAGKIHRLRRLLRT